MSYDGTDSVVGKGGSVHEPNCKSFLLQKLKGSMSGDGRDFNNMETQAVKSRPPPQRKAPKEIHTILTETLGENAQSYATVKNRVPSLNVVFFPPVMRLVDPKQ